VTRLDPPHQTLHRPRLHQLATHPHRQRDHSCRRRRHSLIINIILIIIIIIVFSFILVLLILTILILILKPSSPPRPPLCPDDNTVKDEGIPDLRAKGSDVVGASQVCGDGGTNLLQSSALLKRHRPHLVPRIQPRDPALHLGGSGGGCLGDGGGDDDDDDDDVNMMAKPVGEMVMVVMSIDS
jgi:hypothetical protein